MESGFLEVGNLFSPIDDKGNSKSAAKVFDELFPIYLSYGMTPYEYWDGDSDTTIAYRKANEFKREYDNQRLWLQGMYIYQLLCSIYPLYNPLTKDKPKDYLSEPFPLNTREHEKRKEREEKAKVEKGLDYLRSVMILRNNKEEKDG